MASKYGPDPSPLRIADHSSIGTPDELRRVRNRQLTDKDNFKFYEQMLRPKNGYKVRPAPQILFDFPEDSSLGGYSHHLDDSYDCCHPDLITEPSLSTEYIPTLSPHSCRRPCQPSNSNASLTRATGSVTSGSGRPPMQRSVRSFHSPRRMFEAPGESPRAASLYPVHTVMTRFPTRESFSSGELEEEDEMRQRRRPRPSQWELRNFEADRARLHDQEWIKLARKARTLKLAHSNFLVTRSAIEDTTSAVLARVLLNDDRTADANAASTTCSPSQGTLLLEEPLQLIIKELMVRVETSINRETSHKEELSRLKVKIASLSRQLLSYRRPSDSLYEDDERYSHQPQQRLRPSKQQQHLFTLGFP